MKEKVFKTAKTLMFLVALGQLALSQVHIGIITKVFAPSVGIVLFLFIIFGLVTAFSSSAIARGTNAGVALLGCLAALIMGFFYLRILFADIATGTLLSFADARLSILFSLVAMAVYPLAIAVMLLTRNFDE